MRLHILVLALAVFVAVSCSAAKHADIFAQSKCKKGYEYYFLNRAASGGDLFGVQLLLEGGANVDGLGYENYIEFGGGMEYSSPLMVAVFVYAHEAMEGDPKRVDRASVLKESEEMVELLLKHGANPNIKEGEGGTPLDIAKQLKHEHSIRLLEKYGAK
ncbi:MAG: ankyrin repeat domain-containing protein [Pedobacter sp.]